MSNTLIGRSPDLKKLRDEGYDLEIRGGHLLVKDVPYLNSSKEVKRGVLVSKLALAGDVTTKPDSHVAYFVGDYPCRSDGAEIAEIKNASQRQSLAPEVVINHTFSAKPKPSDHYQDYYEKVATYVAIVSGPAKMVDPNVTAKTFPVNEPGKEDDEESVFNYIDTASSRAAIDSVTGKLALGSIAIVGLGGTGSYVLDLVAKTPVRKIHLFDGDTFLQHNAFRSPGAPAIEELQAKPAKTRYFAEIYSKMHRGIIVHEGHIDESNVSQLQTMDFVFLCLDQGPAKGRIVQKLEEFGVAFVDVGMGVDLTDNTLGGILRITASTALKRDHVRNRISFADNDGDDEYANNIQIADLNALNAALAVIKWKKLFGFYRDLKGEHHTTYTIDGNLLLNEDRCNEE
jgi:hypothetical protein